jgi:TRAP-type C4-dicarboxylate transport system substrate-binding protein
VYSRADISRTVAIVVALAWTAVSASAVARQFGAIDPQSEDYPTILALHYMGGVVAQQSGSRRRIRAFHSLQDLEARSNRQAQAIAVTIAADFDSKPFEAGMAGIYPNARRDPAAAHSLERNRKVE